MQLLPDPPGPGSDAAGKIHCSGGTTKCSAAEVMETVGCRAPLLAGGDQSDVRRNRLLRFRPITGYGAIAQLGERLVCNQEVAGSIPAGSTSSIAARRSAHRA